MPTGFHCSRVAIAEDGQLVIHLKSSPDEGSRSLPPDVRAELARLWEHLVNVHPEWNLTTLFWQRPIKYTVVRLEKARGWEKAYDRAQMESAKQPSASYGAIVRALRWLLRPRPAARLERLLCCPRCRSHLMTDGADRMRCEGCGSEYGKLRGFWNLVAHPPASS